MQAWVTKATSSCRDAHHSLGSRPITTEEHGNDPRARSRSGRVDLGKRLIRIAPGDLRHPWRRVLTQNRQPCSRPCSDTHEIASGASSRAIASGWRHHWAHHRNVGPEDVPSAAVIRRGCLLDSGSVRCAPSSAVPATPEAVAGFAPGGPDLDLVASVVFVEDFRGQAQTSRRWPPRARSRAPPPTAP